MSSTEKQQQQQQRHHRQSNNPQQSRNTNAYFDRDEYYRRSNYWNDDYYQYRNVSSIRKGRQIKNEQRSNNIPPRHREQRSARLQEPKINPKQEEIKPLPSVSLSSTNSDNSNHAESTHRKDLHAKNLAAAAIAARQQNFQPQTNLNVVQTLMNSLILQQQSSTQSQSTVQLQYQLTNALLATSKFEIMIKINSSSSLVIQQRLKEAALQAQAQQIQAAIPTLLAAQALVYQQSGQLTPTQPILPANVAHPGTKFNNRPLVKFPVPRPVMTRPTISTTALPTYQQVQEIERGISLDDAIHLKGSINITDIEKNSITETTE
jgi:hypothetical protein